MKFTKTQADKTKGKYISRNFNYSLEHLPCQICVVSNDQSTLPKFHQILVATSPPPYHGDNNLMFSKMSKAPSYNIRVQDLFVDLSKLFADKTGELSLSPLSSPSASLTPPNPFSGLLSLSLRG